MPFAVLSYWFDEQMVRAEQARSEVGVMLVEMYWSLVQVVAAVHTRSELGAGGVVWYWAEVQTDSPLHVRSEMVMPPALTVGAAASYCTVVHAVSGAHTVSAVVDDGFVAYAVDAHVVFSVQLRSE